MISFYIIGLHYYLVMILQALRKELSYPRTSIQLCLLGIAGGCSAAAVIILFRLGLEYIQTFMLGSPYGYLSATPITLLLLPMLAVLCIVLVMRLSRFERYRLGVPFVIHRVKMHYGHIPLVTSINQFFGGMFSLAGGFVVGKEGPTVHIAAASSNWIGQRFSLPFNSLRILTGCGIAAGIAAAFNTPFAAVIFVMEVVLREYKLHIFVPIMLAAASGSVLTRLVFGVENELTFLSFTHLPTAILPYLVLTGVLLGLLASLFKYQLLYLLKTFAQVPIYFRFGAAASITGIVGLLLPQAMGADFIGVQYLLASSPELGYLLLIFVLKFSLAVIALGLGIPGGIIGAVMVIGMLAGVLLLQPLLMFNLSADHTHTFALLGLAGTLAAVLHAPMAALSAVMELSGSANVILPAIIVIVCAYVTSIQLCKSDSVFVLQLKLQGLPYTTSSIRDTLQNTGVMAVMKTNFTQVENASEGSCYHYLQSNPERFLLNKSQDDDKIVYHWVSLDLSLVSTAAPLVQHSVKGLSDQTTMAEVYEVLHQHRQGAVYIYNDASEEVVGVITWNMLNSYLLEEHY